MALKVCNYLGIEMIRGVLCSVNLKMEGLAR